MCSLLSLCIRVPLVITVLDRLKIQRCVFRGGVGESRLLLRVLQLLELLLLHLMMHLGGTTHPAGILILGGDGVVREGVEVHPRDIGWWSRVKELVIHIHRGRREGLSIRVAINLRIARSKPFRLVKLPHLVIIYSVQPLESLVFHDWVTWWSFNRGSEMLIIRKPNISYIIITIPSISREGRIRVDRVLHALPSLPAGRIHIIFGDVLALWEYRA